MRPYSQGYAAMDILKAKIKAGGIPVLYGGAAANFAANWVGNYPWWGGTSCSQLTHST